jgi:hypothetical protein
MRFQSHAIRKLALELVQKSRTDHGPINTKTLSLELVQDLGLVSLGEGQDLLDFGSV